MRLSCVIALFLLTAVASYAQDGGCFGRGPSPTFNTPVRSFLYNSTHRATGSGCMGSAPAAGSGCMGSAVTYVPRSVTTTTAVTRTTMVPVKTTAAPALPVAAQKMGSTPKTVTGKVTNIGFTPGRPDMVRIELAGTSVPSYLSFTDKDSEVTLDGLAITVDGLVDKFLAAKGGMTVTLYPRAERYQLALKAEFVTVK